jgi:hypothetical protein
MAARNLDCLRSQPEPQGRKIMADISKHVDKTYEQMSFEQLADAPVEALQGVSKGDAELLEKAFHIKTIRDLAENKCFRWAQGIVHLAHTKKL